MAEDRTIGLGSGLAGFILIITIGWALAAVLMLSGTLTNANQINARVKLVNEPLRPIDKHLATIRLVARTGRLTAKIEKAAKPLSGELAQVIAAAGHIDSHVASILTKAQSINQVVTAINTTVHGIGTNVQGIGANVQSIHASVAAVGADVASIHSRVATIDRVVGPIGAQDGSINANVTRIEDNLSKVLPTARSIRIGVEAINVKAVKIVDVVALIKSDFDTILATVGTDVGGGTILGHANSIDCSRLINLTGKTAQCVVAR